MNNLKFALKAFVHSGKYALGGAVLMAVIVLAAKLLGG
jgi:hypothetical protein